MKPDSLFMPGIIASKQRRAREPSSRIVLLEADPLSPPLGGFNHLGVGVESRAEVDRLAAKGADEGRRVVGPFDSGYPVGYWAFIEDPDGHNLEVSHGQEVGLAVEAAAHHDATAG